MDEEEIIVDREGSLEQDEPESGEEDEGPLPARPPPQDHGEGLHEQTDGPQAHLALPPPLASHLDEGVES